MSSVIQSGIQNEVKFVLWYDGTNEDYQSDPVKEVLKRFSGSISAVLMRYNFRGDGDNSGERISFPALLYHCETTHSDGDYVYLIENDYIHATDSLSLIKTWTTSDTKFSYVTLYDSPDYYRTPLHQKFMGVKEQIAGLEWREVLTTTASFLTDIKTLREDIPSFLSFKDFDCFVRLVGLKGRRVFAPYGSRASHSMVGQEAGIQGLVGIVDQFASEFPSLVSDGE